jgi:hypothetical protein
MLRTLLLAVGGDLGPDFAKAGQLHEVDMNQIIGMIPLVALVRRLGLKLPQATQIQMAKDSGQGCPVKGTHLSSGLDGHWAGYA